VAARPAAPPQSWLEPCIWRSNHRCERPHGKVERLVLKPLQTRPSNDSRLGTGGSTP